MAVYKDKKRGTWYVSLYHTDWTGKQQRKLKRGFETKKEAQDWERHFSVEKASSLDMTFGDFYRRYEEDVKPKVREYMAVESLGDRKEDTSLFQGSGDAGYHTEGRDRMAE